MTENVKVDQNYTHRYAENAVSRCFLSVLEIMGFDFSPKNGVQNSILLISSKVLDQIKLDQIKANRILLALNPSCLQYLVGCSNRPNQKVINV